MEATADLFPESDLFDETVDINHPVQLFVYMCNHLTKRLAWKRGCLTFDECRSVFLSLHTIKALIFRDPILVKYDQYKALLRVIGENEISNFPAFCAKFCAEPCNNQNVPPLYSKCPTLMDRVLTTRDRLNHYLGRRFISQQ